MCECVKVEQVCVLNICDEMCQTGLDEGRRVAEHVLMGIKGHKWRKERGS